MSIADLLETTVLYQNWAGVENSVDNLIGVINNLIQIIPDLESMPGYAANVSLQESQYLTDLIAFCNSTKANIPASPDRFRRDSIAKKILQISV